MAESHVVSALVNKRAEIAGMIARTEQQLSLIHIYARFSRFSLRPSLRRPVARPPDACGKPGACRRRAGALYDDSYRRRFPAPRHAGWILSLIHI